MVRDEGPVGHRGRERRRTGRSPPAQQPARNPGAPRGPQPRRAADGDLRESIVRAAEGAAGFADAAEAAFSHYGFSPANGRGVAGFFRDVVEKKIVKGPFVSTFSAEDTVVGKADAISSRLARDSSREIGDASDEFGGIGRNGALKTIEVASSPLLTPEKAYDYRLGVINNLDGSGGLIKNHGDVANAAVTHPPSRARRQKLGSIVPGKRSGTYLRKMRPPRLH